MLSRNEVDMFDIKIHTEILHHIIEFFSYWMRDSVYENNLRAHFHVLTKHVCICPYLCSP